MIADIHMSPDVYQEWQKMEESKQEEAADAIEIAILRAMQKLEEECARLIEEEKERS